MKSGTRDRAAEGSEPARRIQEGEPPWKPGAAWRWGWTAFVVGATTAPYLVARASTPPGHAYTWILPPYPEDSLAYLAWVRQVMEGRFLLAFKYTSLPHAPFLFQPFFLLAGWLARLTGVDPGGVLQILRVIGVVVFMQTLFGFLAFLRLPRRAGAAAAVLAGVSSGLGAPLLWLLGPDAVNRIGVADLWLVDLNIYQSLLWNPLFPYSLALILGAVRWIWEGTERGSPGYWWGAGGLTGILALVHPYHVPFLTLFFAVLSIHHLGRRCWRAWIPFLVAAGPASIFVALQSRSVTLLVGHAVTGSMISPSPLAAFLGLGLPAVYAAAGVWRRRAWMLKYRPLLLWIGLALVLAYSPFWFQRKFFFGLHLPFCILGGLGLDALFRRTRWIAVAVALSAVTPVYLVASELRQIRQPSEVNPYYVSNDLMSVLRYLRSYTSPDDVVFASYEVSRLIPALAGNTVLWGHWAQSVDLKAQIARLGPVLNPRSGLGPMARVAGFWGDRVQYAVVDGWMLDQFGGRMPPWLVRSSRVVYRGREFAVLRRAT